MMLTPCVFLAPFSDLSQTVKIAMATSVGRTVVSLHHKHKITYYHIRTLLIPL